MSVRHVVVFRARQPETREPLVGLLGTFAGFDGVSCARVARDVDVHEGTYDVLLVTEHASLEDLKRFRQDPRHVAAIPKLKELAETWASLDHLI